MATVAPARRSRFLLAGLILAHLTAISHQVDGGTGVSLLQRGVLGVLSPLQRGVGNAAFLASELWRGWSFHRETYAENRRLRERVRALETELQLTLSTDRSQITFDTAPTAAHFIEVTYVLAGL